MGIFTRMVRMVRADVHGVMDQLEDMRLVLAQCMREMEEEIAKKEGFLKQQRFELKNLEKQGAGMAERAPELERDLERAVEKERDELARILIRKSHTLSRRVRENKAMQQELGREILEREQDLEQKRLAHERIKLDAAQYMQDAERMKQARAASGPGDGLDGNSRGLTDEEVEMELEERKDALKERMAS